MWGSAGPGFLPPAEDSPPSQAWLAISVALRAPPAHLAEGRREARGKMRQSSRGARESQWAAPVSCSWVLPLPSPLLSKTVLSPP